LIFSCDGASDPFIVALDRHTGEETWRTARPTEATKKFSFSTPTLIEVEGRPQVISPGSDCVCALDPSTGEILWLCRYDGYSVIPKPVYAHGLVYICTGYNRPSLLAIRPDGTGDVTDTHIAWQTNRAVPHTASLLILDDELYMVSDNGVASCLDARTGEVHWSERLGGSFSASPVYADGRIYFQDEAGNATVIRPGTQFEKLAENAMNQRTLASYAIADNAIFLRTAERLYRIEQPR
jgi:outer membrane protein assembly factor BamB